MKKSVVVALLTLCLTGCNSIRQLTTGTSAGNDAMYQRGTLSPSSASAPDSQLQDYVRQVVDDMAMNMRNVDNSANIAVTTFVRADSDLEHTSSLSFELAEAFMSELHRFGLTTLDFKVARYIRVTPEGDFSLTRDFLELKDTIDADYVLVGTYHVQQNGIRVHARIVELNSQAVLATGETTIPPAYMQYVLSQTPLTQPGRES